MMAPQPSVQSPSGQLQEPRGLRRVLWVLLIVGIVGFLAAALGLSPQRAWQSYLVNFLFWTGIAQAAVLFSAVYRLANAGWSERIRRLGEGMAGFLPVSFLLFLLLFFGRLHLFPWITTPPDGKAGWLNFPFVYSRDGIALIILYGITMIYLYHRMRPVVGAKLEKEGGIGAGAHPFLTRGWRGSEREQARSDRCLTPWAVTLAIAYAFIFSLIAFDLIMSLEPGWFSTLFGAFYFMGSIYMGVAFVAVMAILVRRSWGMEETQIPKHRLADVGNLMLAFGLVTGDFFYSQFLVIWYGNLPEEIHFVIQRTKVMPWAPLAWIVLLCGYLVPVVTLFPRAVKESPLRLRVVAVLILVVMWLEHYLLVVPSLWHQKSLPLGWVEILVTAGFLGAVGLSVLGFWRRFPGYFLSPNIES